MKQVAYGVLLALGVSAALGLAGKWVWEDGYAQGKGVTHEAIAQGQVQNSETKAADALQEVQTLTQYIEVERIVYRDGKTIIQKVPEYVTVKADAACTVPMGFVSLHDHAVRAANLGEKTAPLGADAASASPADALPVPEWADLPAGLPISAVAAVATQNATAFRVLKNRYEKLIDWTQAQCYGPP